MGLRDLVVKGVAWNFAERFSGQLVSFAVSIILARLIAPDIFGVIALVLVFINVLDTFATAGLGSALVQKKNADSLDFSSVLYFNIFFSVVLYIGLYLAAPYIALFYEMPLIDVVIKVMGLRIIFAGINSIQRAYISRELQFKNFFYANFIATVISAVIGIYMAITDFGIWALVAQYLSNVIISTVVLSYFIDWKPTMEFSFYRLKSLLSFGWKLLGSSLLSTVYVELTDLIIGKFYNPSSLAYYDRGKKFPQLLVSQINSSIDTVLFPAMSKHQDDKFKLKTDVGYSIRITSFILFPLIFGLAVVAEKLVVILLTEKWIDSVIYLQISCISYILLPISISNIQAIKAMGRADIYLKLDIIKKIIGVSLLVVFCKQGVVAIALADAIANIIGLFVNVHPNRKLLNYKLGEIAKDVSPALFLSLLMCAVIATVDLIRIPILAALVLQIVLGTVVYIGASYLTKNNSLLELISIAKSFTAKNHE